MDDSIAQVYESEIMLYLSCTVRMDNYGINSLLRPQGPLFHRWLPNGRDDAINVPIKDSKNHLLLWFERRGYSDNNNFIIYDKNREEIDEKIMRLQAKLDAGQLWGEAKFAHVSKAELTAVREDCIGSEEYVALGKRLIKFLSEPIGAFIDVLRLQYGQYWLPRLEQWDSRKGSLGSYCAHVLRIRWRESERDSWRPFRPTDLHQTFAAERLPGREFAEYLTEDDWKRLQADFNPYRTDELALSVLGRAHELCDQGHFREAFVQGVTALELAIHVFLQRGIPSDKDFLSSIEQFSKLPLSAQLLVLGGACGVSSAEDLRNAAEAIALRNDIVHEGKTPKDERRQLFLSLLRVVSQFLGLQEFKTPVLVAHNQLSPPEYGGREALTFEGISIKSQAMRFPDKTN